MTFDFPADPRLRAGAAADSPLAAPGVAVLRYIPLRRITFRTGDVVGKMKRPSSLARAYARLAVAFAAARHADLAVPEPRGLDTAHGAFYQAIIPGRPLADVLAPGNAERLLRALGAVQRELHELPVEGLPERGAESRPPARRRLDRVRRAGPGRGRRARRAPDRGRGRGDVRRR